MKSFKNKKALTFIELITSITIGSIILTIVVFFIASSVDELTISNIKSASIDESFTFRDKINRFIKGGLNDFKLYGTGSNNVVLLQNNDLSAGVIFGVINNNTKKIQKDYIYDDNFIGYKNLSQLEINNIVSNSGVIYDFVFKNDKIYSNMLIKDFNAVLYNGGDILDLDVSVINLYDKNNYGSNFSDLRIDSLDMYEFNLVF